MSAPPRLSDLHGEARRAVLLARYRAQTERFRAIQAKGPGLVARIIKGVVG